MENTIATSPLSVLKGHADWQVTETEGALCIANDEGIEAFAVTTSSQILVEALLFPASELVEGATAKLDDLLLSFHRLLPLTAVSKKQIGDETYYCAFGSLSLDSKPEVLVEEVETLFANVPELLSACSEFLK